MKRRGFGEFLQTLAYETIRHISAEILALAARADLTELLRRIRRRAFRGFRAEF